MTTTTQTTDPVAARRAFLTLADWSFADLGDPGEITIGAGEDTRCGSCLTDLPAGAPAHRDGDGYLCVDCKADDSDAPFIARAVLMAAAEVLAEEPLPSPEGAR